MNEKTPDRPPIDHNGAQPAGRCTLGFIGQRNGYFGGFTAGHCYDENPFNMWQTGTGIDGTSNPTDPVGYMQAGDRNHCSDQGYLSADAGFVRFQNQSLDAEAWIYEDNSRRATVVDKVQAITGDYVGMPVIVALGRSNARITGTINTRGYQTTTGPTCINQRLYTMNPISADGGDSGSPVYRYSSTFPVVYAEAVGMHVGRSNGYGRYTHIGHATAAIGGTVATRLSYLP